MANNKTILESYDYKLVSREEFMRATDLPEGLLERASSIPGAWVVYDPIDDDQGWLLIDDDKEALAQETVNRRCTPD